MNSSVKYLLSLLWMVTVVTVALLIFTSGFLLKRVEIQEYSSCQSESQYNDFASKQQYIKGMCWMPGTFQKVVIIIIDALRYDFLTFNKTIKGEQPFQNKLKVVNEMLTLHPERSAMYKFIADPPTTTLQRLKGLTTGSLPTFVDAGSNFAGANIVEDNIIDQLRKQDKRIVFMGDDTWLDLFPSQFAVKHPFPSLNVKDLDTVDNGVIDNIFHEMNKPDWDVVIGHFLGVDHCGHTYGPYHPMMGQKLSQMDKVLRKVIANLPDESVLLVFGDHGMTRTGDHGGDSKDELEAGLVIYSNKPIKSPTKHTKDTPETVAQIDLVPTLSLLLGLPIPFSNLGKVIPELFTVCPTCTTLTDSLYNEATANHLNSNQVRKYLQSYSRLSDEFPHQGLLELETMFLSASENFHQVTVSIKTGIYNETEVVHMLKNITETYQQFLHDARLMCDKIWAQFDVYAMAIGITYFVFCLAFAVQLSDPSCFNKLILFGLLVNVFVLPILIVLIIAKVNLNGFVLYSCAVISAFPVSSYLLFRLMSSAKDTVRCGKWLNFSYTDMTSGLCFVLFMLYLSGYLSNSYVVYDDSVSSFMLQSMVWLMFYFKNVAITRKEFSKKVKHQNTKKVGMKHFDIGLVVTSPRVLLLLLCLSVCCCLRLATHFRPCREEQWTCETSQFMQPLSAIADNFRVYKNIRYFLAVACLGGFVYGIQKWLRHHGNLNGYAPSVLFTKYFITFTAICVAFYWAFQALPKSVLEKFQTWQQDFFAQLSYVNFLLTFVIIIISPLSVYLLPQEKEESVPYVSRVDKDLVPKMYNHLKVNWQTMLKTQGQDRTPVVYGLGTVYSAVIIMLIGCTTLLLAMLLGDGIVGGIVLQVIVMLLFLEIHACCMRSSGGTEGDSTDRPFLVPLSSIIVWCLICSHFFYATGHQATIPAIRFESAYVGFHGDFNVYVLPAILIILNTFASHTLGILALPLLLFWPCVRGHIIYFFEKERDDVQKDDQRGELVLQEDQVQFQRALFNLFMTYLVLSSIKVLASMLAAGIHKRHLMVWKIFAPRFVFEGAIFLFTSFMLVLVYLIVLRIDKAVSQFIKKLN